MGFEFKIYDTQRCTDLHILSALFIKKINVRSYCMISTPKVSSPEEPFFENIL